MLKNLSIKDLLNKVLKYRIIILSAAVLIIVLVATLIQVQTQQNTQQRAGNEGIVYVGVVPSFNVQNVGVGETFSISLNLYNSEDKDISAVSLFVSYDSSILTLEKFSPSTTFTPVTVNTDTTGTLFYVAVNTSATPINGTIIDLGTLTFKGKALGAGKVTFSVIQVTGSGVGNLLPVNLDNNITGEYTIGAIATSTTIPTLTSMPTNLDQCFNSCGTDSQCKAACYLTFTPTPVPPTPTSTPTPTPVTAPANCPDAPVSSEGKFMIFGKVEGAAGASVVLSGHTLDSRSTDICGMYYFSNLDSSNYNVSAIGESTSFSELTKDESANFPIPTPIPN